MGPVRVRTSSSGAEAGTTRKIRVSDEGHGLAPALRRGQPAIPLHIIPVSKGGSNTARNLELRCETCNRRRARRSRRSSTLPMVGVAQWIRRAPRQREDLRLAVVPSSRRSATSSKPASRSSRASASTSWSRTRRPASIIDRSYVRIAPAGKEPIAPCNGPSCNGRGIPSPRRETRMFPVWQTAKRGGSQPRSAKGIQPGRRGVLRFPSHGEDWGRSGTEAGVSDRPPPHRRRP